MANPSILLCFFIFIVGDNINFVSSNGTDSADGLSPSTAKSLRSTLLLSLSNFQKVYFLPGMYTEAKYVKISHNIEMVGSIRSGDSYGLSNTSADPDSVDISYDVDDIESVINGQQKSNFLLLGDSDDEVITAQVRRLRFVGHFNTTLFAIRNAELTARMCYFAGNCSCFTFMGRSENSKLVVKRCVFQPNSWNTMNDVIISENSAESVSMDDCFFKNVKKNAGRVVSMRKPSSGNGTEAVAVRNCDFRSCRGYNGGVLYISYVKTLTISNCSFCYVESRLYAAVLFLAGPAPDGFSLLIKDVVMRNNTAQELSNGILFYAHSFSVSPFSAESVVNVTYYPIGPNLVCLYHDEIFDDQTSLINSGDNIEISFTSLSDGVSSLPDFTVYDLLSNYIYIPDCAYTSKGCVVIDDDGDDDDGDKMSGGAIAGIILGSLFGGLGFAACVVCTVLYCERAQKKPKNQGMYIPPPSSFSSSSSSSDGLYSQDNSESSSSFTHAVTPGPSVPVPVSEMKKIHDGTPSPVLVPMPEGHSTKGDAEVTAFIEMTATVNNNPASFTAADFRHEFQEMVGRKATLGEVTLFLKLQQQVVSAGTAPSASTLPPYGYGSGSSSSSYPPPPLQLSVSNNNIYPQYPADGD